MEMMILSGAGLRKNEKEGHTPLNAYPIVPAGEILDKRMIVHSLRRYKALMQLSHRVMLNGDLNGSIKLISIMLWNIA